MTRGKQTRTSGGKPSAARRRHPQASDHRLSPAEIVDRIRHSKNANVRAGSIRLLEKYLRRGDRFDATWEALGGSRGVAALMAELSVHDVRHLCKRLGRTASALNARGERRAGLAELIAILRSGETDTRPLRRFYQSVVPASHDEVVNDWEGSCRPVEWTRLQESCLMRGHREMYEKRFLQGVFSATPSSAGEFGLNTLLFRGNLVFCEAILKHLLSIDSDQASVPHDFMSEFALPLLKKCVKRRNAQKSDLNKFLGLIVQCVAQHRRQLSSDLSLHVFGDLLSPNNLLAFTVYDVMALLEQYHPNHDQMKYDLLQLIFKNVEIYRLDLESETSASDQRLKHLTSDGAPWPVQLFMCLPVDKSLTLFERLERLHQGESFMMYSYFGASILQQSHTMSSANLSDIDIVRTVLQQKRDPSGSTWLDGIRKAVKIRMKKATETRDPRTRAFWAKSTLCLCLATRDLTMVHDAFTWAQRFIKDPLVGHEIHETVIATQEFNALINAVSIPKDQHNLERLEEAMSTARHDIEPANEVLLLLIKTAISAAREPSFKAFDWNHIIRLPENISRQRSKNAGAIRGFAADIGAADLNPIIAETIWKPTMSFLLKAEVLMSDPSASKHAHGRSRIVFSGGTFLEQLPEMEPELRADMTTFFLEEMKSQQTPELVKSHTRSVVSAVSRLACSSEPLLAIPYMRSIIENSEDSSSHRELLNDTFIEALPARNATEFLRSTTEAMTDIMKEQNSRSWKDAKSNEQPAIKVTTVKMMANLLDGGLAVDANTAFEILASLLREAHHIDARLAIITSLLSTLEESTSTPALRNRILDLFEESVLPMASQLNERRPTTEEEWEATELPEVSDESGVLKLLVQKMRSKTLRAGDNARLVQIIMAALEQSATNNQRWMSLFLKKHGFELGPESNLSVGPAHPAELETVFELEFETLPDGLFNTLQAVILQNADPPPGVLRINDSIKADAGIRGSPAGQHWLRQMHIPGSQIFSRGLDSVLQLVQRGATSPQGQSRTRQLRRLVQDVAERWMRRGQPELVLQMSERLSSPLILPQHDAKVDWQARSIPIIESIIQISESLREEGISVSQLPDTFRLRLIILKITQWSQETPATDSEIMASAEMISSLVDRLASSRGPYHNDFSLLRSQICNFPGLAQERARAATALFLLHQDDMEHEQPSLAAYLRLEAIAEMLKDSDMSKKEIKAEVKRVIEKWVACPAEDLRIMGQRLDATLRTRKDWDLNEDDVAMLDA